MIELDRLLDVFASRPNRFALIKKALEIIEPEQGETWIEAGCNTGEVTAYLCRECELDAKGVDFNREAVIAGMEKHPGIELICAKVQEMPFADGTVSGIVSEAAFSPLTDKNGALAEYARVLKTGGHVVVNDFTLKPKFTKDSVAQYSYMPCFAGVGSMEDYQRMFEEAGFECVSATNEKNYLASISFHLIKEFGIKPGDIGPLLAYWGNDGHPQCGITMGVVEGAEEALSDVAEEDLVKETYEEREDAVLSGGLTFCQMIFRKK